MLKSKLMSLTVLVVIVCFAMCAPAFADGVLKGGVNKTDSFNPGGTGTTLNRNDVMRGGDPFKGPDQEQQAFDPGSFAVPTMAAPAPPKRSFPLNALQDDNANFDGQGMQGMPGQGQGQPLSGQAGSQGPPPQQFNPNDPDSSPEMQVAWDEWHRRVAEAIYMRYLTLANAAFHVSPPMLASAGYVVTRDGRITNVHMLQKNQNPIYNAIILTAINSLNGNVAVLQFPNGSRRMNMEQSGTFTQNYGPNQGFRTQLGDKETIRLQQQQQQQHRR